MSPQVVIALATSMPYVHRSYDIRLACRDGWLREAGVSVDTCDDLPARSGLGAQAGGLHILGSATPNSPASSLLLALS